MAARSAAVADLAELVDDQLQGPEHRAGAVVNVGGGSAVSLSLRETSLLCAEMVGHCRALGRLSDWRPSRSPANILEDIYAWIHDHESALSGALAGG